MKLRFLNLFDKRPTLVRTSLPGFDPGYYLSSYPDVRDARLDPLEHYLTIGWKEGRDPSANFSTTGYLNTNPDVCNAGVNPLIHFVNIGLVEGRKGFQKDEPLLVQKVLTQDASTSSDVDDDDPEILPSGVYPSEGDPLRIVRRYIKNTPIDRRGINLGSGGATIPDWINIDNVYPWHVTILHDLSGGLPFVPDNSMEAVYSEHFMEHIPRLGGLTLMKEAYRVVRPGGHVRIAMPDLDDIVRRYGGTPRYEHDEVREYLDECGDLMQTRGEWLNISLRAWGHMYIYNYEDAEILLQRAGFSNCRREKLNESKIEFLRNRETRPSHESALIIEATKLK